MAEAAPKVETWKNKETGVLWDISDPNTIQRLKREPKKYERVVGAGEGSPPQSTSALLSTSAPKRKKKEVSK